MGGLGCAWLALRRTFGARGAAQRLQRAWEEGALPLSRRPSRHSPKRRACRNSGLGAGRLVLDCPRSRVGRPRLWDYHSVQVGRADVERLAQSGGPAAARREKPTRRCRRRWRPQTQGAARRRRGRLSPTRRKPTRSRRRWRAPDAQEAGPLLRAVASELRRLFPKGRPALRNDERMERVKKEAGGTLGVFSLRTLERAIALAWPRAKRQRAPKAGKARQT